MNALFNQTTGCLIFIIANLFTINTVSSQAEKDFYNTEKIQEISIDFAQTNWRYLLDSLCYNGEEMLAATVFVNGSSFSNAGVRYRDGGSFTPGGRRNSLFIDLDLKGDNKYADVSEIELSATTRDPSMVREIIGLEMARKYFPAPFANFAKVNVNNEYYGLFVNLEVVNLDFLNKKYGTKKADLFYAESRVTETDVDCLNNCFATLKKDKVEACLEFEFNKMEGEWSALYDLTTKIKNTPEQLNEIIDVDQVLWMLAYNNVFLNLKSYSGKFSYNYYLAKPEGGRFVTLLGKMNLSFGSYKNTGVGSDLKPAQMIRLSATLHEDNNGKPLIEALLSNETYKKFYLAHIRTIMDDIKKYKMKKRIEELHALIYSDFVNDKNRYYSTQDLSNSVTKTIGKRSKIPGIINLIKERRTFLKTEKSLKVIPPKAVAVSFEKRKQFSNDKVTTFKLKAETSNKAKVVMVYYRYNDTMPFQMKKLYDDGKHFDESANDKTFGIELIPGSGEVSLEYYLTVENSAALSFYPINYQMKKAKITLAGLNN